MSEALMESVRRTMTEISSEVPCLKFVEKKGKIQDYDYPNIIIFAQLPDGAPEDMCVASTIVRLPPYPNAVFLNPKCKDSQRWAAHGLLQVFGVTHELNRMDRDRFLAIKWENIRPEMFDAFAIDAKDFTSSFGVPFDHESVMMLPSGFGVKKTGLESFTATKNVSSTSFNSTRSGNEILGCGDIEVLKKLMCCHGCNDYQSLCGYYANSGFCSAKSHWFWMKTTCAKSCAICCPESKCSSKCSKFCGHNKH